VPTVVTAHDYWWFCQVVHYSKRFGHPACYGASALKCASCGIVDQFRGLPSAVPATIRALRQTSWVFRERRHLLRKASCVIQVSEYGEREYRSNIGKIRSRIISTALNHPPKQKPVLVPRVPVSFGALGALRAGKGGEVLIRACRVLRRRGIDFRMSIWGPVDLDFRSIDPDADTYLSVYPRVYDRSQLDSIFGSFDVFVLASSNETLSLVALEASASRTPIIVPRLGATSRLVHRGGRSGLLYRPNDERDLARAMQSIIRNPDIVPKLQDNMPPPLDYSDFVDAHESLYGQLQRQNDG
jgi:glycosyltransferase involved in cell wall biosynthesis